MLLERVVIKNFRCFGNQGIDINLGKLNLIIGENNSGKTSFLDAIKLTLSRAISRKASYFDLYDHYISSENTSYPNNPLLIRLYFFIDELEDLPDDYIPTLDAILQQKDDRSMICLQVKSEYNTSVNDFEFTYSFLDQEDNELPPKTRKVLYDFLHYHSFFYMYALRDAIKEFSKNSTFWSSFTKNPNLSDEEVNELQAELEEINQKAIDSNELLKELIHHLEKTQTILSQKDSHNVSISAVPTRISDIYSKAQLNYSTKTGLGIPLERHGSGTQSLSVIFLFEAYMQTILLAANNDEVFPILALEEPEAHLHPSALKALWNTISKNNLQQIITTHSGEILTEVPIECIFKFINDSDGVNVLKLNKELYTKPELRKIRFHISETKGALFFAKTWIMVEGETEFWLFNQIAEARGISLSSEGIEILRYAHFGIEAALKCAKDFSITTIVLSDGDSGGRKYAQTANEHIPSNYIYELGYNDIEHYLCVLGFGQVYLNNISDQKREKITLPDSAPGYWPQVLKAQNKVSKIEKVIEVTDQIIHEEKVEQLTLINDIIDFSKEEHND